MCDNLPDVVYLDRKQLRLLADPVRHSVLKLLAKKEMSTSGLAAELGDEAPRNLYYHVHRLHSAGLIRLVRTEPRRGTVEKFYRAVAKVFAVKSELAVTMGSDRATQGDVLAVARRVVEDTLNRFATSVARKLFTRSLEHIPPVVAGVTIRASEERLQELGERLRRWVADLSHEEDDGAEQEDGAKMEYSGLVMFFPTEPAAPVDDASASGSDAS